MADRVLTLMEEGTGAQIHAIARELELRAAELIGRMLFDFSRVEVNLALAIAWLDSGRRREEVIDQVERMSFSKKLACLSKAAAVSFPARSGPLVAYRRWIDRAHAARMLRNRFVHGRWGISVANRRVVNVLGLPGSNEQTVMEFSIEDLEAAAAQLQHLLKDLVELRGQWPL